MIPAAYEKDSEMSEKLKEYYKYASCRMEPWDGPAFITFSDGKMAGGILDRNGLRPARFVQTKDNRVIITSEIGALPLKHNEINVSARISPGECVLIDTEKGQIVKNGDIVKQLAGEKPYGEWLKKGMSKKK